MAAKWNQTQQYVTQINKSKTHLKNSANVQRELIKKSTTVILWLMKSNTIIYAKTYINVYQKWTK